MPVEENKILAVRIMDEIFNRRNMNHFEELFSPDIAIHDPDKELRGSEQVRQGIQRLHLAFPDIHYTTEDILAEGDKVVIRFKGHGTHGGDFRGVPATGKTMTYTGIMILRFVEGQAVDYWAVSDALGIFQQLGVIPSFGSSSERRT